MHNYLLHLNSSYILKTNLLLYYPNIFKLIHNCLLIIMFTKLFVIFLY